MNRLYSLKRILTFIIAFAVTAGIAGSSWPKTGREGIGKKNRAGRKHPYRL